MIIIYKISYIYQQTYESASCSLLQMTAREAI